MNNENKNPYPVECCNSECNWKGTSDQCITFKHGGPLLCPECCEVTEFMMFIDDPRPMTSTSDHHQTRWRLQQSRTRKKRDQLLVEMADLLNRGMVLIVDKRKKPYKRIKLCRKLIRFYDKRFGKNFFKIKG